MGSARSRRSPAARVPSPLQDRIPTSPFVYGRCPSPRQRCLPNTRVVDCLGRSSMGCARPRGATARSRRWGWRAAPAPRFSSGCRYAAPRRAAAPSAARRPLPSASAAPRARMCARACSRAPRAPNGARRRNGPPRLARGRWRGAGTDTAERLSSARRGRARRTQGSRRSGVSWPWASVACGWSAAQWCRRGVSEKRPRSRESGASTNILRHLSLPPVTACSASPSAWLEDAAAYWQ